MGGQDGPGDDWVVQRGGSKHRALPAEEARASATG